MKILSIVLALIISIICVYILGSTDSVPVLRDYDFGNDGKFEEIRMQDNKLQILRGEKILFSSNIEYEVNDFDIGDINNDGEIELIYGFWRSGDYGKELDYQQLRRDPKKSYHLYIYKYSEINDNFYLIWGSSTLPHPIFDFQIVVKDDNFILKVQQGSYEDYDKNGEISPVGNSYWTWNEWWFEEYKENKESKIILLSK